MAYIDVVNKHESNNLFKYNHKEIFKQVRKAMKKNGEARDNALKSVLISAYKSESPRYERIRQEFIADLQSMTNHNEAERLYKEVRLKMADPAPFLAQMCEIVGEMAKDVDKKYQPKEMLGLSPKDCKNLVSHQLNSYTRLDETMHALNKFGWNEAHRTLGFIKNDSMGEPRKFATTDEEHKVGMYEVYVRKEELKKQLDSKGFFWKLRYHSEVKAMKNYIRAAEDTLTSVEFPEKAIKEAQSEFALTAATMLEYEKAYAFINQKYDVILGGKNEPKASDVEISKSKVEFARGEFNDSAVDKANKVEEKQHNAKLTENKKA